MRRARAARLLLCAAVAAAARPAGAGKGRRAARRDTGAPLGRVGKCSYAALKEWVGGFRVRREKGNPDANIAVSLDVQEHPDRPGDAGIFATRELAEMKMWFAVPRAATIGPVDAAPLSPPDAGEAEERAADDEVLRGMGFGAARQRLAVALLRERLLRKRSAFWAYVACLPKECVGFYMCSAGDAALRRALPSVWRDAVVVRDAVIRQRRRMDPPLDGGEALWLWACSMVLSRAFVIKDIGPVLVPFADMMNHARGAAELAYLKQKDLFYANGALRAGEEAQIPYGSMKRSNQDLLLQYGFISDDDGHDHTRVRLTLNVPGHIDDIAAARARLAGVTVDMAPDGDTNLTAEVALRRGLSADEMMARYYALADASGTPPAGRHVLALRLVLRAAAKRAPAPLFDGDDGMCAAAAGGGAAAVAQCAGGGDGPAAAYRAKLQRLTADITAEAQSRIDSAEAMGR